MKESSPWATISMNAQTSGTGYVTSPGAFFYRSVGGSGVSFTSVGIPHDTCNLRQLDPVGSEIVDTLPIAAAPIDAGAFITMQLSGRVDTLHAPGPQTVGYHLAAVGGRSFNPGDTVVFTTTGSSSSNGFPASQVALQTAEAFTLTPVVFAASGQDVQVTWTPASGPGSLINLTFSYETPPVFQQVYCQFIDDGQAAIPAHFFTAVPNVLPGAPINPTVTRLRTALVQVPGSDAIVNVVSTFQVPTPNP